ncbi:MAG: MFS transporter, partial [Proteobacteria bacterium]|nr:MFS transporter [Pseudomonadota bacterium]
MDKGQLTRNLRLYRVYSALAFTPVFLPVLVLFWQDNGLNMFDVFLLQGLFAISAVILEVPTGMVADRMGKRASLLMAQILFTVGIAYYAMGHGFWSFLLAEIVLAVGVALLSGADTALLFDTLKALKREDEYTRWEGETRGIQMAAFAIANLVGGFLGAYSLRATVWASAIGPFIALFIVYRLKEVQERRVPRSLAEAASDYSTLIRQSLKFVSRHRLVQWQVAFMAVLMGSSAWLLWLYQPYMEFVGLPIWFFGVAFAIFNLFAAFMSRFAHVFDKKLGQTGAIAGLMLLQTAPLALLALIIGPASFVFILGQQAVRGLSRPIISNRILQYTYADKRATVLSISALSARLFFGLTAPIIGLAAHYFTMEQSLLFQLAILVV